MGKAEKAIFDVVLTGLCHSLNDRLAGAQGVLYMGVAEGHVAESAAAPLRRELDRVATLVSGVRLLVLEAEEPEPLQLWTVLSEVAAVLTQAGVLATEPDVSWSRGAPAVRARLARLRRLFIVAVAGGHALSWEAMEGAVQVRIGAGGAGEEIERAAAEASLELRRESGVRVVLLPAVTG